ncbi:hypothetical protein EVAR_9983_1 [Eumeta japonica]|uniref:Uncharacterized protein n=1 Tax=Eumeta variegata TaxID=151549 RepID=A0A4C1TQY3_EUMVA|nr:hypothetical protein EVAR_9983_1 [Eumeta japonica]
MDSRLGELVKPSIEDAVVAAAGDGRLGREVRAPSSSRHKDVGSGAIEPGQTTPTTQMKRSVSKTSAAGMPLAVDRLRWTGICKRALRRPNGRAAAGPRAAGSTHGLRRAACARRPMHVVRCR